MRSRRAGLKRIGLLAISLVIALGGLGVAHAAWTDSIYLQGTVNTGTFGADICGVSSTYVYKIPGLGQTQYGQDIQVDYYCSTEGDYTPPGGNAMLVAQAIAFDTSQHEEDPVTHEPINIWSATMTFMGVFPGIDFLADVELHYLGTIPAKISLAEITPLAIDDPDYDPTEAQIIQELLNLGETSNHTEGIWLDAELSTDGGDSWVDVPNTEDPDLELLGLPLNQGDRVRIHMHVLLPEDPAYEHLSLNFSGQINNMPWNMYEES